MIVHGGGNADPARFRQTLQTRCDVDAVAEDIATFDDHIAEIYANAEPDAFILRDVAVAVGHAPLDLDRATHRVDDAGEFD